MTAYLLESSAAVKLYVREVGTAWVVDLVDPARGHELFVVRITGVEVAAALFRRVRGTTLTGADATLAAALLRRNLRQTFEPIEVTPALAGLALEIAERHALRGYDCVQLAGALLAQQERATAGLSPLILISADDELNAAAVAEGLGVENPNHHP